MKDKLKATREKGHTTSKRTGIKLIAEIIIIIIKMNMDISDKQ